MSVQVSKRKRAQLVFAGAATAAVIGVATVNTQTAFADSGNGQVAYKSGWTTVPNTNRGDGIWSKPYGQSGATYLGNMNDLQGRGITVYGSYTDSDSGTLWVEFDYNGQRAFVDAKSLNSHQQSIDAYSYQMNVMDKVTNASSSDALWTKPYGVQGAEYVGSADINNQFVFVKSISYDKNGVAWAHIIYNNQDCYIAANLLSDHNADFGDSHQSNKGWIYGDYTTISANSNASALTSPWGENGSTILKSLSDVNGQSVQVVAHTRTNTGDWVKVKTQYGEVFWLDSSNLSNKKDGFYKSYAKTEVYVGYGKYKGVSFARGASGGSALYDRYIASQNPNIVSVDLGTLAALTR